jgi:hypothetical protein
LDRERRRVLLSLFSLQTESFARICTLIIINREQGKWKHGPDVTEKGTGTDAISCRGSGGISRWKSVRRTQISNSPPPPLPSPTDLPSLSLLPSHPCLIPPGHTRQRQNSTSQPNVSNHPSMPISLSPTSFQKSHISVFMPQLSLAISVSQNTQYPMANPSIRSSMACSLFMPLVPVETISSSDCS